jgi:glutathione S-transferase
MSLKLYGHPLSSFCHKVLIALYERDIDFEMVLVNLGDERSSAAFHAVWPMAKMPALRDEARGCTVAESTVVIEYLDAFYGGGRRMLPADPDLAWQARMWDRFHDHYLEHPLQKLVGDWLRPPDRRDPFGVEEARALIRKACGVLEQAMAGKTWAVGESFGLAECAAAPALFYINTIEPFGDTFPNLRAYLDRLVARPTYRRVLEAAQPYFSLFPLDSKPQLPA